MVLVLILSYLVVIIVTLFVILADTSTPCQQTLYVVDTSFCRLTLKIIIVLEVSCFVLVLH